MRLRVALLVLVAVCAAPPPLLAASAGTPTEQALEVVMAAYRRLREDHLEAREPSVLLRAAVTAMGAFVTATSSGRRPAGVPAALPSLSPLPLGRSEAADLDAVRAYFLRTAEAVRARIPPAALAHAAVRGLAAAYDDPYTLFLSAAEHRRLQQRDAGRPYAGIGVTIQVGPAGPVIRTVLAGGPAQRSGLRPGDLIVRIDGLPVLGLDEDTVIGTLRGAANTRVRIEVRRVGVAASIARSIVRATITPPLPRGSLVDGGIAYLRLAHFDDASAQAAVREIAGLDRAGARGLILDLRGNGGGSVLAALLVASAFLERGPVAVAVGRNGKRLAYPTVPLPVRFTGPVVVLVDGMTASSAELVASALQDAGATLVGRPTYGKALIQSIVPLPDGSALKYTSARYLTPKGRDFGRGGLPPDVLLSPGATPADALGRAIEQLRRRLGSRPLADAAA